MSSSDLDKLRTPGVLDLDDVAAPGRGTLTSRLVPPARQTIIFRVESAEAAAAIADRFGPRDGNGVASGADVAVDRAASSSGDPLPGDVRARFEASTGADLSGVRVHTGSESAQAAAAVGAQAYTTGQDIHFAEGKYAPSDPFGLHLLAHEVAHTVQQSGGAASGRQNKLEVSTPGDALEREADRAADAMVAGRPADVAGAVSEVARKVFRDTAPSSGTIQGAGDEAQMNAMKTQLSVDNASVSVDQSRVAELIAEINKHTPIIQAAEKQDSDMEAKYGPLAANTATKAKLEVFGNKLDVSAVDTTSFAVQYRQVYGEYQRLTAEANEVLAHAGGANGADPLAAAGEQMAKAPGMKIDMHTAGLERFRAARANMNTAAQKMDGQLTQARGAANQLQAAIYRVKAAAAAATGKDAASKLEAVNKEIADIASGVGTVVKVCSAVAGLAGTGGNTGALATAAASKEGPAPVTVQGGDVGVLKGTSLGDMLEKKQVVDVDPEKESKLALIKAMGQDAASLGGGGGGPDKMAEQLVTAIGKYANKEKIAGLQATIAKAAAEEASFKAAGDAQAMVGYQDQMEAASKQLSLLIKTFDAAKAELNAAGQALMAELNKSGGKSGKDQAKGVLFLTDADRFMAQVDNALSVGDNQQQNLKQAASDRKGLRGSEAVMEGGKDQKSSYYFRCTKTTVPGRIYGTNDIYRLEKVFVTFQDNGLGENGVNQGGKGSVEGTGGAADEVAKRIETLKKAKEQVQKLQTQIQGALGMGGPGLNA